MTRSLKIALIVSALTAFVAFGIASAHADLLRSDPAANSVQDSAPSQVSIWFNEAIEPGFSTITVLFEDGSTADRGDSLVSPADPTQLSVTLAEARDGTYLVSWRVLSAVDGHITAGSFVFSVGQPIDRSVGGAGGGAVTSPLNTPLGAVARALNFIGQATLVGVLLFRRLVWRPALESANLEAGVDELAVSRSKRVVYIALGLAAAGVVLTLLVQSALAGAGIPAWLSTRIGRIWIGRAATLVALAVLADDLAASGRRASGRKLSSTVLNVALAWLGLQLLFTTSLTSHSATISTPPIIPIATDWLHLLGTAIWVGGLAQMAFVVPAVAGTLDDEDRAWLWLRTVVYFSTVAAIGLGVLLVTGTYMSFLHIGDWSALLSTVYGRTLLFKLALAGIAMLIGAFNLFVVKPRLDRAVDDPDSRATRRIQKNFRRIVAVEAVTALAVLASAGILTDLPRSKDPQPVAEGQALRLTTRAEDLDAALTIDPALEGNNTFDIQLKQAAGGAPVVDAGEVSLRFTYLARSLGATDAEAALAPDGAYSVEGAYLSLPGDWQIEVIVRRPDAFDAFAAYRVKVGLDGRIGPSGETTIVESAARWLSIYGLGFGGVAAMIMGVIWIVIGTKASRNVVSQVALMIPALIAIPIGALSAFTFFNEATPGLALSNPFLPDEQSLIEGQRLFEANCAACHGMAGRGNGEAAASLTISPPDFGNGHLDIHTDGDVFYWIRNGLPRTGSPMPAFGDRLSEDGTWHLVNYVRRLRNLAGQAAPDSAQAADSPPSALQPYTPPSVFAPPEAALGATPLSPTPSASGDPAALDWLARADAAMNRLTSLVEEQALRDDAGNQIDVVFTYAAPDRLRYQIAGGATAIQIGLDDYQLAPDDSWIKNQRAVPFAWPNFFYGDVAEGARLDGEESLAGADTTIVAFRYGGFDFRFWIDAASYRILRLSMEGRNHHMLSTYGDFDGAATIERPIP
jgi:copper transport protein